MNDDSAVHVGGRKPASSTVIVAIPALISLHNESLLQPEEIVPQIVITNIVSISCGAYLIMTMNKWRVSCAGTASEFTRFITGIIRRYIVSIWVRNENVISAPENVRQCESARGVTIIAVECATHLAARNAQATTGDNAEGVESENPFPFVGHSTAQS